MRSAQLTQSAQSVQSVGSTSSVSPPSPVSPHGQDSPVSPASPVSAGSPSSQASVQSVHPASSVSQVSPVSLFCPVCPVCLVSQYAAWGLDVQYVHVHVACCKKAATSCAASRCPRGASGGCACEGQMPQMRRSIADVGDRLACFERERSALPRSAPVRHGTPNASTCRACRSR